MDWFLYDRDFFHDRVKVLEGLYNTLWGMAKWSDKDLDVFSPWKLGMTTSEQVREHGI